MAHLNSSPAHAKYSASGSKRWLSCPGSTRLSEQVAPNGKESPYAKEGTDAHLVLDTLIKSRKNRSKALIELRRKYPASMIVHAEMALDYIEKRLKEHPGAELHSEIRADLPVSEPGQFGTTDAVLIEHFGRLIVIDYKYGAGIPVEATENSQLIYYALGVAHKFDYNFSEVEIVIIQPRAQIGGEYIRSDTLTLDRLLEWKDIFEKGIQASKKKDAPLLSGDHCRFCPAKIICPEIKNKALRSAQAAFNDETGEITLPEIRNLHPKIDLPKVLPALDKLEIWIKALRQYAFDFIECGGSIAGYDLVEMRGQRKWVKPTQITKQALKLFGLCALTRQEILSPAQFEKVFQDDKAKKFLEENTITVSNGLKLAQVMKGFKRESEVKENVIPKINKTKKQSRK